MKNKSLKKILAGIGIAALISSAGPVLKDCHAEGKVKANSDNTTETGSASCSGHPEKNDKNHDDTNATSSCSGEKAGSGSCSGHKENKH